MERERLEKLLEHWIEHNRDHTKKYEEWAKKLRESEPEISKGLLEAVVYFRKGEATLEDVRDML